MIIAIPREDIFDNRFGDEKGESFKSQNEHSYLDVIKLNALKYVRKEDSVLVCISECAANQSSVCHILDIIVESGCEDVVFLIENDKLIKSIKKKTAKRGRRINIVRGSLSQIDSNLATVNVVIDVCSVQYLLSKKLGNSLESDANELFANVTQILKDGGRFLCMMDANKGLIDIMLTYFKDNWFVRVQCFQMSAKSAEKSLDIYSPFALLTLTKLKIKLPKPVLEIATRTEKAKRVDGEDAIRHELSMMWSYSHLQEKLRREMDTVNTYAIDYWSPKTNSESQRYTVHIIDSEKDKLSQYSGKYGVFIVPIGQEISWLYASEKGRRNLAIMAGFERLAVISTHRGHSYGDLEAIQEELSSKVLQLAPPGLNASTKVPFVTAGDDVGKRDIVFESGSAFEGYVVEDVKMDDGYYYRRLIFKKNPALVQSEFRILNETGGDRVSSEQCTMDLQHLVFLFHRRMVATLSYINEVQLTSHLKILVIGLGGGALPNFIAKAFANAIIVCVELDPQVVDIAKKWFGLKEDSNIQSVIADGLEFMLSEVEQGKSDFYDAIFFDVNTDDNSMALTGPPMDFLEDSTLERVKLLLNPSGVFTMNLVCRDCDLRMKLISIMKNYFKHAVVFNGDEDELNVVVMCLSPRRQAPLPSNADCSKMLTRLSEHIFGTCSSDPLGFSSVIARSNAV